ncbi:hypothetical protein D3C87_1736870 [compost metagenome]
MMCSGLVTLPQSCSQAPRRNSYRSASVMATWANGPSVASHKRCISDSASCGTLSQWPPVYGLLASIASASRRMTASNSFFCPSIRLRVSMATDKVPESFSTNARKCTSSCR